MLRRTCHLALKRAAGPFVGIVAGLLLANALFSWWQEQDWQLYRASAKTRGLILDFPDDARRRVPPEENLAAEGPFASLRLGEDGKPLDARRLPTESLPYDLLPQLSVSRAPDWESARLRLVEASPVCAPVDTAEATLQIFEVRLRNEWREVLAAEAKPEAQFHIRYWPIERRRQMNLVNFRIATQSHAIRAVAFLEQDRPSDALEEVQGILRLCDALRTEPTLECTTLRAALLRIAVEPVWHGINVSKWSDAELDQLGVLLDERSAGVDFTRAMDHERAWINAVVDELMNSAGFARGRLLRSYFDTAGSSGPGFLDLAFSDGYVRANQIFINRYFDSVRERINGRGDLQTEQRPSVDLEARRSQQRIETALADTLLPNIARAERRLLSVEARLRQARIAIAIERYRQRTQTLPAELEELVPGLLQIAPTDPFTGQVMRYRIDGGGAYRLWSVGEDGDNDGALPDPEDGQSKDGDLVWAGKGEPDALLRTAGR